MNLFDCAEFNPNCTATNLVVAANPDISGIGVVIGFFATTCLAITIAFSVLFLDNYERFRNIWRIMFNDSREQYEVDGTGPYWRSPEFWSKILSKNLLSFSDTQLTTGLAMQFTAIIQHCRLSVYHFKIIAELAFLTTVIHLLTLVVLRNYFVRNKWANLPRILIMIANLSVLEWTSCIASSYGWTGLDSSSSLACFFKHERPPLKAAWGWKYAMMFIGAIGGHATVIIAMYTHNEKLHEKYRVLKHVGFLLRTWFVAPVYAVFGIVFAGISLGRTQAFGKPSVRIEGSEMEWTFGQFLPVLLLALPLFAGWESFWEENDEDRDNRFVRSRHPSRTWNENSSDSTITSNAPRPIHYSAVRDRNQERGLHSPVGGARQASVSNPRLVGTIASLSPDFAIPAPDHASHSKLLASTGPEIGDFTGSEDIHNNV